MEAAFGAFIFNDSTRELRCGTRAVGVSPKAFELLRLLLCARPAAVSKDELHAALWPDTFVSDGTLAVLIAELRRALGDSAQHPSYIRTVNRFGYAFVGDAGSTTPPDPSEARRRCFLTWGTATAWLGAGEHVLGRDPAANIVFHGAGVSRRHAVICIAGDQATLSDLSSKNGTFVDGRRIASAVPLTDGAEIRLGTLSIRFRRAADAGSTQTVAERAGIGGAR